MLSRKYVDYLPSYLEIKLWDAFEIYGFFVVKVFPASSGSNSSNEAHDAIDEDQLMVKMTAAKKNERVFLMKQLKQICQMKV